jgi:hypothetical protein
MNWTEFYDMQSMKDFDFPRYVHNKTTHDRILEQWQQEIDSADHSTLTRQQKRGLQRKQNKINKYLGDE